MFSSDRNCQVCDPVDTALPRQVAALSGCDACLHASFLGFLVLFLGLRSEHTMCYKHGPYAVVWLGAGELRGIVGRSLEGVAPRPGAVQQDAS